MKKTFILVLFLTTFLIAKSQNGFGLEGSAGLGLDKNQDATQMLITGRDYINENMSLGLGIGLWNSGFKRNWSAETDKTAIIYKLSNSNTTPLINLSLRYSLPLASFQSHEIRFFLEPSVNLLPALSGDALLTETHFTIQNVNGEKIITPDTPDKNKEYSYKSKTTQALYYQLQGGFSVALKENLNLNLGYGFSSMDLFKQLRGQSLSGFSLNNYLPKKNIQLITIGLQYRYNL